MNVMNGWNESHFMVVDAIVNWIQDSFIHSLLEQRRRQLNQERIKRESGENQERIKRESRENQERIKREWTDLYT